MAYQIDTSAIGRATHAVSGASLSLFSNRYFTSEMSKQPALLNSEQLTVSTEAGIAHGSHRYSPGPSFNAAASSSSVCGLCRSRGVDMAADGKEESRELSQKEQFASFRIQHDQTTGEAPRPRVYISKRGTSSAAVSLLRGAFAPYSHLADPARSLCLAILPPYRPFHLSLSQVSAIDVPALVHRLQAVVLPS